MSCRINTWKTCSDCGTVLVAPSNDKTGIWEIKCLCPSSAIHGLTELGTKRRWNKRIKGSQ